MCACTRASGGARSECGGAKVSPENNPNHLRENVVRAMSIASNIVVEWLHSLHLGEYAESFVDNGYDDLEICKQISEPDLDAIGVFKQSHRLRLLQSVKRLREEGAASVYFTLEESSACLCESGHEKLSPDIVVVEKEPVTTTTTTVVGQPAKKFLDEYEEGKAELVRIPRMQLRLMLQEKLRSDGIRLACQPYTTPSGERGYLEGLASRYADLLRTHYGDVLEPLEELRRRETNASPRISNAQLTTSHSQPIYVPGKYSPSSCLSDKEEDEIYGFGYGVFGRQMLQQRQQKLALATQNLNLTNSNVKQKQSIYQSCLSPRSAFFYEFPPSDQGQTTSKKKTTFSRILRGLKAHRKEKHAHTQNSPRHQQSRVGLPQRVDTPDSVLHSGLGLTSDMGHTVLRSMVDPRDYDRVKYLQTNGAQTNSFEETIHRLKMQEAMRKKERFNKEHEQDGKDEVELLKSEDDAVIINGANVLFLAKRTSEANILRDIRHGLKQLGRDGQRQYPAVDDTYMYDEEARCGMESRSLGVVSGGIQHWYDEPPYESDPEDFLMGCSSSEADTSTTNEKDRRCYKMNITSENHNEGIISLRTAGDISLPKARKNNSTMRGLIVPQGHNNPPTIIPLKHSKISRESGEYASSDVQSRSSDEEDIEESPRSQSTDYEDTEMNQVEPGKWHNKNILDVSADVTLEHCDIGLRTIGGNNELNTTVTATGIAGRARNLRQDVQRKISRLRQQRSSISDAAFPCSASSVESLPSGSGSSSTQALVRAGSNHSSISCEDRESNSSQRIELQPTIVTSSNLEPMTVLCRAKALVDCMPSPYDKEALAFKKGDIIDVLQMNTTGLWKGSVHNRFGHFKFINVEIINERFNRRVKWGQKYRQKPGSVPELLQRMNLKEYISVFLLNGYEDLELFRELESADLDYLRIHKPDHRAKILTAVQLLNDLQSGSEGEELAGSSSEADEMSSIDFSMSRLGINGKRPQRSENDLDAESSDNKSTEFQANVPLHLPTAGTSGCINTPIDQ